MNKRIPWLFVLLLCLPFIPHAAAQGIQQYGRHSFVLSLGSWSTATDGETAAAQAVEARSSGFVGTFSHRYWITDTWAVGPYVSLFSLGEVAPDETAQMTAIMFSLTYSFRASPIGPSTRFYLSMGFGPYMSSTIEQADEESMMVSTFGTRMMAGMDWYFNQWVLFNITFGYHLMPDFSEPVGTISNFSGAEMSMGVGIII